MRSTLRSDDKTFREMSGIEDQPSDIREERRKQGSYEFERVFISKSGNQFGVNLGKKKVYERINANIRRAE